MGAVMLVIAADDVLVVIALPDVCRMIFIPDTARDGSLVGTNDGWN
jgi:hypothetical protein